MLCAMTLTYCGIVTNPPKMMFNDGKDYTHIAISGLLTRLKLKVSTLISSRQPIFSTPGNAHLVSGLPLTVLLTSDPLGGNLKLLTLLFLSHFRSLNQQWL